MSDKVINPNNDLLLQVVSNPHLDAINYSASYENGSGSLPSFISDNFQSKYDYFSYPFSVCPNSDSLLVASADLVVGLTSRDRSITDTGFSEIAFIPLNPEERKFIYFSQDLEPIFKYLLLREPLSIYMSKVSQKSLEHVIGNDYSMYVNKFRYQKVASILDMRSYLGDTGMMSMFFTTSFREANDAVTCLSKDGTLIYMTEHLRERDIVELSKYYKTIYLWNWKLVSPKTCVICKFPFDSSIEPNVPSVSKFVEGYTSWINSIQVPNGPIPSYPFIQLLNLP